MATGFRQSFEGSFLPAFGKAFERTRERQAKVKDVRAALKTEQDFMDKIIEKRKAQGFTVAEKFVGNKRVVDILTPEQSQQQEEEKQLSRASKLLDVQTKTAKLAELRTGEKAAAKTQAEEKERIFKQSKDLRAELTKTNKDFKKIKSSFGRILSVADKPSAASDLALIFNYMKILDPGSVVRESEFRNAEQAKAWLSRSEEEGFIIPSFIRTAIQKATPGQKGAFLIPEQRADFVSRARDLFNSEKDIAQQEVTRISDLATSFDIPQKFIGQAEISDFPLSEIEQTLAAGQTDTTVIPETQPVQPTAPTPIQQAISQTGQTTGVNRDQIRSRLANILGRQ